MQQILSVLYCSKLSTKLLRVNDGCEYIMIDCCDKFTQFSVKRKHFSLQ